MSQIVERFESAVQALVADGPIKRRLRKAYTEFLEDLRQVDLPIAGNADFSELHTALHSVTPVGKIDPVRASVQKMSPGEAWWHAQTIVKLYSEVLAMERSVRSETESALVTDEAEPPPRFLVHNS